MPRKRSPPTELEVAIERALSAFYALEQHLRALPSDRRGASINFMMERLRRLRVRKAAALPPPDARQLDLPHG